MPGGGGAGAGLLLEGSAGRRGLGAREVVQVELLLLVVVPLQRVLLDLVRQLLLLQLQRASEGSAAPTTAPPRMPHRRITSWSGAGQWDGGAEEEAGTTGGGALGKDAAPMRELKKLYGLIKTRSRKEGSGVAPSEEGEAAATAAVSGRWSGSGSNHGMER